MKKMNILLFCLALLFLSSCSVVNDPVSNEASLYRLLGKYAELRGDFKCDSLVDAKQFTEDYLLTKSGTLYEMNMEGKLFSSTNENCAKINKFENINFEAILPKGYKYLFYANSNLYNIDYNTELTISSFDQAYYSQNIGQGFDSFTAYGVDLKVPGDPRIWPYTIFISSNKPYFERDNKIIELVIANREDGDTLKKLTRFALFSGQATI